MILVKTDKRVGEPESWWRRLSRTSKDMKKCPAVSSSALMMPAESRVETSVVGRMAQLM